MLYINASMYNKLYMPQHSEHLFTRTMLKVFKCLKKIFIDLRLVSVLMIIWLIFVILIMIEIGIFSNSDFVAFGPRKQLSFMKVPIDTYYKYNMLITMIILHTIITDFIADSLSPHVLNIVQDPKTRYIPHKPITYISITTIWSFYCSISQIFVIFIAFAQLDLLLVRLFSDIFANMVTTNLYLSGKQYNPEKCADNLHQKNCIELRENVSSSHINKIVMVSQRFIRLFGVYSFKEYKYKVSPKTPNQYTDDYGCEQDSDCLLTK